MLLFICNQQEERFKTLCIISRFCTPFKSRLRKKIRDLSNIQQNDCFIVTNYIFVKYNFCILFIKYVLCTNLFTNVKRVCVLWARYEMLYIARGIDKVFVCEIFCWCHYIVRIREFTLYAARIFGKPIWKMLLYVEFI